MTVGGELRRELGVGAATLLGLGSIVGTGVYVSIGIAAGVAGSAVVAAVVLAAAVATFNGLSSAQLAAAHPVSGGTYEYGYRYLSPWWGVVAGWTFLVAKSASAATAAIGFAGYLSDLVDIPTVWRTPLALAALGALTMVVLSGIRRSSAVNAAIVVVAVGALVVLVLVAAPDISLGRLTGGRTGGVGGLLEATALMFVAYTGYGRIATLGEEVREPYVTIPRAIIATLVVTMLLYASVAVAATGSIGADALAEAADETAAPLEAVARSIGGETLSAMITVGAVVAMLGVLLNLLLGLSRVVLAMGRRHDLPARFGTVDAEGRAPRAAVLLVAGVIAVLALVGDVRATWSVSAFTVLVYYAITNLAALKLPPADRRFPRLFAWAGLISCLFLAIWIDPLVLAAGLALVACGLIVRAVVRRRPDQPNGPDSSTT